MGRGEKTPFDAWESILVEFGLRETGARRRRPVTLDSGFGGHKGEWMEAGQDSVRSPTVFLAEQPPRSVLQTHFHRQNEFQLVVQGAGMLGPRSVRDYTLHYAGAYTGYGPIAAGEQGLSYFTIRATFDTGLLLVPEDVAQMVRGPKLQAHSRSFDVLAQAQLEASTSQSCEHLINTPEDCPYGGLVTVPPQQTFLANPLAKGAGAFFMILGGALHAAGRDLGLWESIYLSTEEEKLPMRAGPRGCQLLHMELPLLDAAYARDPTGQQDRRLPP